MSVATFEEITADRPYKPLTERLKKHAGRNNQGKITTRHRGGGHKRLYRIIDWKRNKIGVPGRVQTIEYDPNRSANIALVQYADGEKRYILAPLGLRVGDRISAGPDAEIRPGNAMARGDPALVVAAGALLDGLGERLFGPLVRQLLEGRHGHPASTGRGGLVDLDGH